MLPPSPVLNTKKRGLNPDTGTLQSSISGSAPSVPCAQAPRGIDGRELSAQRRHGYKSLWTAFFLAALGCGCAPSGPKALMQGEKLIAQGKYVDAAAMLERATRDIPEQAQAWNHLGLAYHYSGQKEKAVQAYAKALERNRNLEVVHHNLSQLFLEHGEIPAAIDSLTRYLIHKPDAAESWLQLGLCHLRLRQWDAAERALQAHLRSTPKSPEALNALGLIQVQRRKYREAYSQFHAATQARPGYPPAVLNMATVAIQFLNYRAFGVQKYREFLGSNPEAPHAASIRQLLQQLEPETHAPPRIAVTSNTPIQVVKSAPTNSITSGTTTAVQVASSPAPSNAILPPPIPPPRQLSNPPPANATPSAEKPPAPLVATPTAIADKAPTPAAPATSAPIAAPLPVVVVPAGEEEPKPATAPIIETARAPQTPNLAPNTDARSEPGGEIQSTQPLDRPGLLSRLNPQSWFKKSEKPPTPLDKDPEPRKAPSPASTSPTAPDKKPTLSRVTNPRPAVEPQPTPTTPAPATPQPSPPPAPSFPRYTYRKPPAPGSGNREAARTEFTLGASAQEEGRLSEAISHYQASAQADPAFFDAWFNLAIAQGRLGHSLPSLEAYERALAIQPDSLSGRFNFALALQKASFPEDAAAEFSRLARDHPRESRIPFALGNVYAQTMRRPDLARTQYARVLELEPNHPQAPALRHWLAQHP